jgi:hypothetical protein
MTDESAFLHELETTVKAELAEAEAGQPETAPIDQWIFDPADAAREEAGLRSLLGAVEALEGGGDHVA